MIIDPKYLEIICKKTTNIPGSKVWCQYISDELYKIYYIQEQVLNIRIKISLLTQKYNRQLKKLNTKIENIQATCTHDIYTSKEITSKCYICNITMAKK